METLSIAAISGAVVDFVKPLGKILLRVLMFGAVLVIIGAILPADPFRPAILAAGQAMAPYYNWINLVVPVPFCISIMLFDIAWRYISYLYKKFSSMLLDRTGGTIFKV